MPSRKPNDQPDSYRDSYKTCREVSRTGPNRLDLNGTTVGLRGPPSAVTSPLISTISSLSSVCCAAGCKDSYRDSYRSEVGVWR